MHIASVKTYLFIGILALVLLHAFSFGPAMGMETDKSGQMSACPFTEASSICKMGFSEHISLWQSMFTATLNSNAGILAIIGFIVLAVVLTLKYLVTDKDKELIAYKSYDRKRSIFLPNKLIELFSKGILNPKIYALATL